MLRTPVGLLRLILLWTTSFYFSPLCWATGGGEDCGTDSHNNEENRLS